MAFWPWLSAKVEEHFLAGDQDAIVIAENAAYAYDFRRMQQAPSPRRRPQRPRPAAAATGPIVPCPILALSATHERCRHARGASGLSRRAYAARNSATAPAGRTHGRKLAGPHARSRSGRAARTGSR